MPDITKPDYLRQSGIISIEQFKDNRISIIGCGAIGSFVATSLAKMGLQKFMLCDMDKVEAHNLPNQFFTINDLNKLKVDATKEKMLEFNPDCDIIWSRDKIEETGFPSKDCNIVISCVDIMETRKYIFDECKRNKQVQLFIDTRMAGLQGQLYVVDMTKKKEIKNYEKSLFSSKDAVQIRCTERSIIFTVLGIASLVCNQIIKAFKCEELNNFITLDYNVPQLI